MDDYEELLDYWKDTNDLDKECMTVEGWHYRRGQMTAVRELLSLLEMKQNELEHFDDDEVESDGYTL